MLQNNSKDVSHNTVYGKYISLHIATYSLIFHYLPQEVFTLSERLNIKGYCAFYSNVKLVFE